MALSTQATVVTARSLDELEPYRTFIQAHHLYPACNLDVLCDSRGKERVARPHALVLLRGSEPRAVVLGRVGSTMLNWSIGYKKIAASEAKVFRTATGGILGDLSCANDCEMICDALMRGLSAGEADAAQIAVAHGSPLHR